MTRLEPRSFVLTALLISLMSSTSVAEESDARAPPERGVVLLGLESRFNTTEAFPEAERRISAELLSMRLRVHYVDASEADGDQRLEELIATVRDHGAVAGLWVSRRDGLGTVRLWVGSGEEELLLDRTYELSGSAPVDVSQLALSVGELLHASLLELQLAPRESHEQDVDVEAGEERRVQPAELVESPSEEPVEAEPPIAPQPEDVAESPDDDSEELADNARRELMRSPRRFRLSFAAAAPLNFDPMSIMMAGVLSGGIRVLDWLVVDIDAQGTVIPAKIGDWRGDANVYMLSLRALATFEPWPRAAVRPGFQIGGGLLFAWALGDAATSEPGYEFIGITDFMVAGVLSLGVRLAIPITRRSRVLVATNVGLSFPDVPVRFGGEQVSTFGRPLFDVLLGFEWGLGAAFGDRPSDS